MIRSRWLRSALIGVALCSLAVGLFLYLQTVELLKPPVQVLPMFQTALRFIDRDEPQQAVPLLQELIEGRPRSPLLLFYLSAALDAQNTGLTEAESQFIAALAVPGAERRWSHGARTIPN